MRGFGLQRQRPVADQLRIAAVLLRKIGRWMPQYATYRENYDCVFSREQVLEQVNCVASELEDRVQLQQLMSHMTVKEKEVVCMRAAGYTYREIAEHCNITMRGVSARLIRMRRRFRALALS